MPRLDQTEWSRAPRLLAHYRLKKEIYFQRGSFNFLPYSLTYMYVVGVRRFAVEALIAFVCIFLVRFLGNLSLVIEEAKRSLADRVSFYRVGRYRFIFMYVQVYQAIAKFVDERGSGILELLDSIERYACTLQPPMHIAYVQSVY